MSEQIISKRCSKCKQTKPVSEFSKYHAGKLGYHNQCKSCKYKYGKSVKAKLYQKRYRQTPKGKEVSQKVSKKYGQSAKGIENEKRRRIRDIEKCQARSCISNAIKLGKIPPARIYKCTYCPAKSQVWHHYKGYEPEHWLDVIPVCHKCDSAAHRNLIKFTG